MAAKDLYHQAVVKALEVDGWMVRKDPLAITFFFVDLGIEGVSLIANRSGRKIAIEIKSFLSTSPIKDFQETIGQYLMYELILNETDPEIELWLAVPVAVYDEFFLEEFTLFVLSKISISLVIFDQVASKIVKWIPSISIGRPPSR